MNLGPYKILLADYSCIKALLATETGVGFKSHQVRPIKLRKVKLFEQNSFFEYFLFYCEFLNFKNSILFSIKINGVKS